jgi:hypothetical protein
VQTKAHCARPAHALGFLGPGSVPAGSSPRANFRNFREFPGPGANFRATTKVTLGHAPCRFVTTHKRLRLHAFLAVTDSSARFAVTNVHTCPRRVSAERRWENPARRDFPPISSPLPGASGAERRQLAPAHGVGRKSERFGEMLALEVGPSEEGLPPGHPVSRRRRGGRDAQANECRTRWARSRAWSSAPRASVSSVTRTKSRIDSGTIAYAGHGRHATSCDFLRAEDFFGGVQWCYKDDPLSRNVGRDASAEVRKCRGG